MTQIQNQELLKVVGILVLASEVIEDAEMLSKKTHLSLTEQISVLKKLINQTIEDSKDLKE